MNSCAASCSTCSPRGFVRIRNFGFLANRSRTVSLPLCFQLLSSRSASQTDQDSSTADGAKDFWRCPHCAGPMAVIKRLTPPRNPTPLSTYSGHRCRMSRRSTAPVFRVSGHLPSFCVFSGNQSLLRLFPVIHAPQTCLSCGRSASHVARCAPCADPTRLHELLHPIQSP